MHEKQLANLLIAAPLNKQLTMMKNSLQELGVKTKL